jgi:hypothetical protein
MDVLVVTTTTTVICSRSGSLDIHHATRRVGVCEALFSSVYVSIC